MNPEYWRLTPALLLSLLMHALLLTLTFGGQGLWPGFGFPWQPRRIEAPDLRVVVVPGQVTAAESLPQTPVEQTVASGPLPTPSISAASAQRRPASAITVHAKPKAEAKPTTDAAAVSAPPEMPLRADRPGDTAPAPNPAPTVIAATPKEEVAVANPPPPTPAIVDAPSDPSPEVGMPSLRDAGNAAQSRLDQEASERAADRAKLDAFNQEEQRQAAQRQIAQQDAARQEAAQAMNAQREAARAEAARVEAARVETAKVEEGRSRKGRSREGRSRKGRSRKGRSRKGRSRKGRSQGERKVEAAKVEAAKVEAAKVEAAKVEAAKVEAAKVEAAKVEAAKVEAAKAEAARQDVARAEAAKAEAARQLAAKAESAKAAAAIVDEAAAREARLRAIGRQLDEESARRDAATTAARQSPPSSSSRRYRLFGRTDPNAELILYAEAWARKIQLNMTFDMVREAAKQAHTDPVVTVAIRSDGSVESVTFVKSSGVAALDDAIRRVVHSQAPYQEFPAGLIREFDVIEIRRTWYFDVAIRLY